MKNFLSFVVRLVLLTIAAMLVVRSVPHPARFSFQHFDDGEVISLDSATGRVHQIRPSDLGTDLFPEGVAPAASPTPRGPSRIPTQQIPRGF